MPKELLLEIGTEEIPARFIPGIREGMRVIITGLLKEHRIGHGDVMVMTTPRRLVVWIKELKEIQDEVVKEVLGPSKTISFDAKGEPTRAAIGFARSQGVSISEVTTKVTEKGEYLLIIKKEQGKDTKGLLTSILPRFVLDIPFPKAMRWGDKRMRFVRPIRWIMALFGDEVVDFEVDGIKSSNLSRGHRFMNPGTFAVKEPRSYFIQAKNSFVVINNDERKAVIKGQLEELAKKHGTFVLEDDELSELVTNLVEYPVVLWGDFGMEYLELPREVLISAMREHQRYFSVVDKKGNLLPHFLTVSNTRPVDVEVVKKGNERVLQARLSDARFFLKEDKKRPLVKRVEDLRSVVFQERLGTLYDKVMRIAHLSVYIGHAVGFCESLHTSEKVEECLDSKFDISKISDPKVRNKWILCRAAFLSKTDLLTGMVGEFPKLQGIMGRIYASLYGEREEVALAIYEHYLPRFSGDELPKSTAGRLLAIADKMDNITGCFGLGLIPTGSEDPYALRRQAQGIIQIVLSVSYSISLEGLVDFSLGLLRGRINQEIKGTRLLEFFRTRVEAQFALEGHKYDTIDAALSVGFDDPADAGYRVRALTSIRKEPEFEPLIISFKRVANILPEEKPGEVEEPLLNEKVERELYERALKVRQNTESMIKEQRYGEALKEMVTLRPFVDAFFDGVMVMDKRKDIRRNRLALLGFVADIFLQVADLSKVVVSGGLS